MRARIAEHEFKGGSHPKRRYRVDLHGVSHFGPGDERTLIRWEWIKEIFVDEELVVKSGKEEVRMPAGTFGMAPADLAQKLQAGRSITERPEVIGELAEAAGRRGK